MTNREGNKTCSECVIASASAICEKFLLWLFERKEYIEASLLF